MKFAASASERLRRVVRGILPAQLYCKLARAYDDGLCIRRVGYSEFRRLRSSRRGQPGPSHELVTFRIPTLAYPIEIRRGANDASELVYTAIREPYGIYSPPGPVRTIVDAGAHIGDSSAWYLTKFPEACVIAVEPHPANFRMLQRNCAPYGSRAVLVPAALWSSDSRVAIQECERMDAISVHASPDARIPAICMTTLMERTGVSEIDVFKCDVEGAETEIFSSGCDAWLSKTRSVIVEVHGPAALRVVSAAMRRNAFQHLIYRNLHVFYRSRYARVDS